MIVWTLAAGGLLLLWLLRLNKNYSVMSGFAKRIKTTDGSPVEEIAPNRKGKTMFANTFDIIGMNALQLFQHNRIAAKTIRKSYVEYILGETIYNVIRAEDAESVMNDINLISKGLVYAFLEPFLRTGLLLSTDKKWHARRKMLTPAFHFNILEQFEEIFKEESAKFVESLKMGSGLVSLSKVIPKFTLNSVCETALGVQLDECLDGDNYRKSFKMIEECFVKRISNPFFMNEKLFNLLEGRKYEPHLKIVHEFSSGIIEKRRRLFAEEKKQSILTENRMPADADNEDDFRFTFKKKRYAMLDTLLHAEGEGLIDHVGICEEVDTFMFEGFDTTSMGLTFALMNMSVYTDSQERCFQEIQEEIDGNLADLSISQLNQLKYLECFLKESLRLYPPVPVIMRKAVHDAMLNNKLQLPAGTQIAVHIFDIHRDPQQYPNPDVFDPERFTAENSTARHPYAFMPFSAGQRNCIGQKFAMLEMKTLLVYILKNFKIEPVIDPKDIAFEVGIIIRSFTDIKVKFVKRE